MALTDLTRISTSGIATGSTIDAPILRKDVDFRGDQVGVGSALFDSSERELNFKDNVKLTFGDKTNGDLQVYHNGADNYIDAKTGSLYFRNTLPTNTIFQTGNFTIKNQSNNQNVANFAPGANGGGLLYHENILRFNTTSSGAIVSGILTATSFSGGVNSGMVTCTTLDVNGNGDISGNLVLGGDLTVNGTTTTLDTNLIDVDRIAVGTTGNNVAVAVTQSGSGDLVQLYDGTASAVNVKGDGKIGIATALPLYRVDIGDGITDPASGYQFRINAAGDYIFALAKQSNASFSIRNNSTSVVHLNTQNSKRLAFGVSTGPNSGSIEQHLNIITGGDVTINRTSKLKNSKLSITKDANEEGIGVQLNQSTGITTSFTTFNAAGQQIFSLAHDTDSTPDLIFKVKHSSDGAPAEKLRITSSGSVNIGGDYSQTSSKLKVTGTVTVDGGFALSAGTFTAPGGFSINSGNVIMHQYIAHDADPDSFFGFPGGNRFKLELGGKKTLEARADGNVGFGTDNPQNDFEVYGHSSSANGAAPIFQIRNGYSGTADSSNALKSEFRVLHKNHNATHDFMATRIISDTVDNYNQRTFLRFLVAKGNNGTERLTISPEGNVGINTTVFDSSADLSITNDTSARIYLKSGNASDASIYFGRHNDSATAAIRYEHSDDALDFYGYNNSKKLTIKSDGHVIPGGDVNQDLGANTSYRWRNIYGQTLSLTSYATIGAIVAADPGSAYYAYNNRIGNGLAIVGNTRMFNNIGIGTGRTTGLTNWESPSDMNLYLKSNNASGTIRWNYEDSGGTVRANHAFVNYGNGKNDFFTWATHDGSSLAERVRITKEGTVGIHTAIPNTYFKLDVNGNTNVKGTLALPSENRIYFGNSDVAWVKGKDGGSGYLELGVNNAHVTLTRAGHLQLISGNLEFADGAGIDFSNSTLGGPDADRTVTTDGNKLDDYEEGTFVPQLNGMGTVTYDLRAGRYTKIGNVVYFQLRINLGSSSGGNHAHITNMPFTQSQTTIQYPHCTFFAIEDVQLSSNHHPVAQFINSEIYLYQVGYQSSSNYSNMDENQIKDSSQWGIFGFYYTAT